MALHLPHAEMLVLPQRYNNLKDDNMVEINANEKKFFTIEEKIELGSGKFTYKYKFTNV